MLWVLHLHRLWQHLEDRRDIATRPMGPETQAVRQSDVSEKWRDKTWSEHTSAFHLLFSFRLTLFHFSKDEWKQVKKGNSRWRRDTNSEICSSSVMNTNQCDWAPSENRFTTGTTSRHTSCIVPSVFGWTRQSFSSSFTQKSCKLFTYR